MTLRLRFALWVAALLLVALAAFGAFVYFSLAHGLTDALDDSLRLSAAQAIAAIKTENGQIDLSGSIFKSGSAAAELHKRDVTIRVFDRSGQILQTLGPYLDLPLAPASLAKALRQDATLSTLTDAHDNDSIRSYTAAIVENGQVVGVLQVLASLDNVQEALARLRQALLLGSPLLALAAAFGGYFLAARALAPIDQITRTARRISAEDLSRRLDLPATNDEVGRLAATFDGMLARLDDAFRRERQFTADASHELRTPLAAMQAILSVTRAQRRSPEDYEAALADLADETDRLRGLTEDLLRLARGETPPEGVSEEIDLSTLLDDVADSLRPLAEAKGLALICDVPAGLAVTGDRDALIRLFVNLLDNAVKYTARGSVTVAARAGVGGLQVTVADTGSGMAAEDLPHVFDRFYRADQGRTEHGTGLGLAIARQIAQGHGGALTVESTPNMGSIFTVSLPT